jgi:hypothetical protein
LLEYDCVIYSIVAEEESIVIGRIIIFVIVIGIIGLVVGYFIFGRIGGEYIQVKHLFEPAQNILEDIAESITGIQKARRNIWISGAVGAAIGLIVAVAARRRV